MQAKILIVDDKELNRIVLKDHVAALGYSPILAGNGLSAMAQMRKHTPDLVLLDIMMPEMDGYEVLERMKIDSEMRHIPVIVISALDDMENVVKCIERGAEDYLVKPFNPVLLRARIETCIEKKRLRDQEKEFRQKIEDYSLNLEDRVQGQVREISESQLATIFAMSRLAESRDTDTGEHLERMREYCKILAKEVGMLPKYSGMIDVKYVEDIHATSPLHDIGKVGIPDRILLKPEKLTDEEFALMKAHTTIGADTLRDVEQKHSGNSFVRMGIDIAQTHHEKWDGSGYPHGLGGEDIPLPSRILCLGDVYDALTNKRPYKEPFSHEKSREIIVEGKGKHFDPDVIDAFLATEGEFISIRQRFQNI